MKPTLSIRLVLLSLPLFLLVVGLAAQDEKPAEPEAPAKRYPPLPLNVHISRRVGKTWKPPLPQGFKLLDFDGPEMLATIEAKDLIYLETGYLRLISTVPPQKVTPKTWARIKQTLAILAPVYPQFRKKYPLVKGEALAHYFALHMHRTMVDCWKILGSDMDTYEQYLRDYKHGPYMRQPNKFEIYLFGKQKDYLKFADAYTGRAYRDGVRHRAPVSDVLALLLPPPPGGAKDFHGWTATVIHNWSHNVLMSEIKNSFVIPVWLDVGFAHWFERREGDYNTYCFDESGDPPRFASGDWLPKIRTMVATGRAPELEEFFNKTTLSEFTGDEHGICYGMVDYLIRERVQGLKPFCYIRRETKGNQRKHFREAWGESPTMFYERARVWIKENYGKKKRAALREPPAVLKSGDPPTDREAEAEEKKKKE